MPKVFLPRGESDHPSIKTDAAVQLWTRTNEKQTWNVETPEFVELSVVPFGPLWQPVWGGWGAHQHTASGRIITDSSAIISAREICSSFARRVCGSWIFVPIHSGLSSPVPGSYQPTKTPSETSNGGVSLPLFLLREFKQDSVVPILSGRTPQSLDVPRGFGEARYNTRET